MLSQQDLQIITRIKNEPQVTVEHIHPALRSLEQREYINVYPAKTILGSETGLYMFNVTEAGNAAYNQSFNRT